MSRALKKVRFPASVNDPSAPKSVPAFPMLVMMAFAIEKAGIVNPVVATVPLIVGEVNVLFVNVCASAKTTIVSEVSGMVSVRVVAVVIPES